VSTGRIGRREEERVNELARYLIDNLVLDFKGEMDVEDVRAYLREDDSPEARALLSKILDDGIDELLFVLAECLQDFIRTGITENIVRDRLREYIDS
jgi:hypothetical protein